MNARSTGTPTSAAPALGRLALAALLALALLPGCQKSVDDRLADVRAMHELGAWEESIEELREVLDQSPDHPEANYLLGVTQMRLGQPSLAIWPLQMARRDPELVVDAGLALGGAYLQLEQLDAAAKTADEVLEQAQAPEHRVAALRLLASTHLSRKEFDKALEDADQLLELDPGNPQASAIRANALLGAGRLKEAEADLRTLWENTSPENADAAARAGIGLVGLYEAEGELRDPAAAERQLEALIERFPADANVVRFAAGFYDEHGEQKRANEVLRAAVEAQPVDLRLRSVVSKLLASRGFVEEGEAVLVEGTELLGSAPAWLSLAQYRSEHGAPAEALEAVEKAVELMPEPIDGVVFQHADLLITNGELERAEALVGSLEKDVYRQIIEGRIAYARQDYARALDLFDQGLRRWPNNPGARYLAGRAALSLGRVERAVAEFREALRADAGASDAGIDLARIHMARGQYRAAAEIAGRVVSALTKTGGGGPRLNEALLVYARAHAELGNVEEARNKLLALAGQPDGRLPALVELAALVEQTEGPAAAADALAGEDLDFTDPENVSALRALAQYLVDADRPGEARDRAARALEAHPDEAVFHDVRGRVLFNSGQPEEAAAAFERAIDLDPELAPALEGLARVAEAGGDRARALELLDRAAETEPANPAYPYGGAQLALAGGDAAGAERRLREALRRDATYAEANNDLAWILAQRGEDLDEALTLAQRAAAGLRSAAVLDTLGWVQLRRGQADEAAETLEEARALEPASPSIAYRLSLALVETGERERARELLEEALDSSAAFPEAESAREQLARLETPDS